MKITFVSLIALFIINCASIGQTVKEYEQKANECFSKKDYKSVIENLGAKILIGMGDKKKALKSLQNAVKLGEDTSYVFELMDKCNNIN